MKVIYLVRHGQASFGQANYDQLSPLGIEQSQWVADYLLAKGLSFDTVISGSLQRHQQTATPWLERTQAELIIDPRWNEFDHQALIKRARSANPAWIQPSKSLTDDDLLKLFQHAIKDWINPANEQHYSESWSAFNQRVTLALNATLERTQKTALVFTSGGVISALIGQQWHLSAEQSMRLNWSMVNTGISKLLVRHNTIQVSTVNEYAHLDNATYMKNITYK
ncbi:MAG: histidine phosphatase family protein [Reinekea sp.]|nr:histidine phosphatase family protein [Reinekea sp.]